MKKVLFLLLAVIFVSSLCFAQEASVSSGETTAVVQVKTKTFVGKVASVNAGDSMAGMKPQITATDESGRQWTFQVASDASIVNKNGEATSLSWIGKDSKVEIKYTETQDSPKMAQSVKVLEDW
jgi:uncharacterized protein YxeA